MSYLHPGSKLGVLLELNCETDFVAKMPEFLELARDLAMHIAAMDPKYVRREDVPEAVLAQETGDSSRKSNEIRKTRECH